MLETFFSSQVFTKPQSISWAKRMKKRGGILPVGATLRASKEEGGDGQGREGSAEEKRKKGLKDEWWRGRLRWRGRKIKDKEVDWREEGSESGAGGGG